MAWPSFERVPFGGNLASALESMLGASARLPIWLLSPTSAAEILPYLANASQGGFSAKKTRFLGVTYAGPSDASQRTAWLARMAAAYPNVSPVTFASADAVAAAFRALSLGGATFEGTLGAPDIDPPHGTWNGVGGVYCYGGDAVNTTIRYDVLRWNRNTGALDGTFDCFVGF